MIVLWGWGCPAWPWHHRRPAALHGVRECVRYCCEPGAQLELTTFAFPCWWSCARTAASPAATESRTASRSVRHSDAQSRACPRSLALSLTSVMYCGGLRFHHDDSRQTDVDCGGFAPLAPGTPGISHCYNANRRCATGKGCAVDNDCVTRTCTAGVCAVPPPPPP